MRLATRPLPEVCRPSGRGRVARLIDPPPKSLCGYGLSLSASGSVEIEQKYNSSCANELKIQARQIGYVLAGAGSVRRVDNLQ